MGLKIRARERSSVRFGAFRLRILAGLPATVVLAGTSFVTRLPAPTIAFSPIVIPPSSVVPEPIDAPRLIRVFLTIPIRFALQLARGVGRTRIFVVDEGHTMTNENIRLDDDAFADKGAGC